MCSCTEALQDNAILVDSPLLRMCAHVANSRLDIVDLCRPRRFRDKAILSRKAGKPQRAQLLRSGPKHLPIANAETTRMKLDYPYMQAVFWRGKEDIHAQFPARAGAKDAVWLQKHAPSFL